MSRIMDIMDDFIYGPLNYVDRLEGLLKAIWYQDSGYRFAIPRLDKGGRHSLEAVSNLLTQYGIAIYCRTYDSQNRYFRVKKRQATWAEYLLLHAGVELRNPRVDPRNAQYAAAHPPGWMPTPWAEKNRQDLKDLDDELIVAKDASIQQPSFWERLEGILDDLVQ